MGGAPAHWSRAYLGCTHEDCAAFVRRVRREVWAHDPPLPEPAGTYRGRDAQIRLLAPVLARRTPTPAEGCAVLMTPAGRRPGRAFHLGLWCDPGAPSVLHAADGVVRLEPLVRLHAWTVEGVYEWI